MATEPADSISWSRRWSLYERAAELPAAEWEGYMRRHAPNQEMCASVLQMLRDPQSSLQERHSPDSELAGDRAGTLIGRYRVQGRLGHGGMGEVYSAHDEELCRPVALKFVRSSEVSRLSRRPGVMQEAKSASALNHPHIVTVHEVISSGDDLVIVMELVPGVPLRALCGQLHSAEQVRAYGRQIGRALAAAHAAGIVHRDVKPENLIVRPDGYIKLLDFGLARDLDSDTSGAAGPIAGTLRYMSPEQIQAKSLTAGSDVFSLGVVLYELLTGRHPFVAPSLIQTLHGVTTNSPPAPERINPKAPVWLSRLILRMIEKEPARRPSTDEVVSLLESGAPSRPWWRWGAAALALTAAVASSLLFRGSSGALTPNFIKETSNSPENHVTAVAVAPEGGQIAFGVVDGGVYVRDLRQRSERLLAAFPNERIGHLSWVQASPRLLISTEDLDSQDPHIYTVNLIDNERRQLPISGGDAELSPDGNEVAYLSPSRREIRAMSLDGAGPRRLAAFSDSSALTAFVWSPSGRRLHYFTTPDSRKRQYEWRRSILHTADALTGQETGSRDLPPLSRPVLLRDGRLLYYSQKRGTTHPFVEVAIDPETGQLRGEPKPFTSDFDSVVGGVAASADGKIVAAVVGGNDTFSLSYAAMTPGSPKLGPKHRSSNDARPDLPDAWSPDNSTIFFESNRQGHYHIFRHRIGQRSSELVSDLPGDQTMPRVSPDGRWLLFLSAPVHTGAGTRLWNLMRVPIAGGTAERVPFCEPVQEFNCLYKASRCVIREQKDGQMRFYHLDPEKGKGRELARSEAAGPVVFGDWTLSPDGAMVAMVNLLRDPAAIRVIYLDRGLEHEIPIQGPPPTSAVVPVWRADGKGWYFPVAGDRMRQFDWQGRSLFVDDMEFWLVPTTDGKQVAFQDRVRSENVWICRRQ